MDATPLNLVRPEVPVEVAAIVAKMMAKEPGRRFQEPKEVAQALKPFFKAGNVASVGEKPDVSRATPPGPKRETVGAGPGPMRTATGPEPVTASPGTEPERAPRSEPMWESLVDLKETGSSLDRAPAVASNRRPRWLWPAAAVGALLLALIAVWATGVIKIKTPEGYIVLRGLPDQAVVLVDGKKATVHWPEGGGPAEITAVPGDHEVEVKKDGFTMRGQKVTVERDGRTTLMVQLEPLEALRPEPEKVPRIVNSPASTVSPTTNQPTAPSRTTASSDTTSPNSTQPGNRDRRAAEAVLRRGGSVTVRVNGQDREIGGGKALPTEAFQLTGVYLWNQHELTDAELEPFEGLPDLIHFNLQDCPKVTDAGIARLRNLPRLGALDLIETGVTGAGLVHLEGLSQLKHLFLVGPCVTDAGLVGLRGLAQLEWLTLARSDDVTDAGLVHLKGLTELWYLNLSSTQVTGTGFVHLKGLKRIKVLHLHDTGLTDDGLVHLKGLQGINRLELNNTRVTAAGLVHLSDLARLESLQLGGKTVRDTGLEHLKGLTRIKSLELLRTRVTDKGLVHLRGLAQLEWLSLAGSDDVTDAGLVHLKGLTGLRELTLEGTSVTAAGVEGLKKTLLACRISADP